MKRRRLDAAGTWVLRGEAVLLTVSAFGAVMSTLPLRNIDPGEGAERSADPAVALPVALGLVAMALPLLHCAYLNGQATLFRGWTRLFSRALVALAHLALLAYGLVLLLLGVGLENRLLGVLFLIIATVALSRILTMRTTSHLASHA